MQNNEFRPASEKQIEYLRDLNYEGNPEELTFTEAMETIRQLTLEKEKKAQAEKKAKEMPTPMQPKQESNKEAKEVAIVEGHSAALQIKEKNISDKIFNQISILQNEQGLELPKNYNVSNALKSAYLTLAANDLLNTDQTALAQALLDMCIQGLTPAKRQCYFINYGGKVNMMRSYFGDKSVCINAGIVQNIEANVIYQDDVVNVYYVDDRIKVEHKTSWDNFGKPIIGAYAWAILPDGTKIYDIMTMDRIKKSWSMSKNNSNNKLQNNYSDDACKRTVIRHMAKSLFNASGDNEVISRSYNSTTENEYDNNREFIKADVKEVHEEQKAQSGTKNLFDEGVMEDDNI